MTNGMRRQIGAVILVFLGIFVAAILFSQEKSSHPSPSALYVTKEDLLINPVAENWPSYNGDYTGRRYSRLSAINRGNVAQMRAASGLYPFGLTGEPLTAYVKKAVDDYGRRAAELGLVR